jgi:hypothetical protein
MLDEAQARSGLKLHLHCELVQPSEKRTRTLNVTSPNHPTYLITGTLAGSTSVRMILRAIRVQDARLF